MSVIKVATLLWILLNGYYCIGIWAEYSPPQIELATEYILHANDNFNITCESYKYPKWDYPQRIDKSSSIIKETVEEINDVDYYGLYKYRSVLFIKNASFLDTGFFYCHDNDAEYSDETASAKTYLFVKDENHLAASDSDVETVITADKSSEVILPCRPTSPDVKVSLYKNAEDIQKRFDYKIGYYLPSVNITDSGLYNCVFEKEGLEDDESVIILRVYTKTTSIYKPRLEDLSYGHTLVGGTLILNCSLPNPKAPFDFKWMIPQTNGVDNPRVELHPAQLTAQNWQYSVLKIQNVSKSDQGNYSCKVIDFNKNENIAQLFAPIYELGEMFIHLKEENDLTTVEENAGSPAIIRVDIDAHPLEDLKLQWLNNVKDIIGEWEYNKTMPLHIDNAHMKYITEFRPTESTLEVKNININDFGEYTIVASNNFTKVFKTFTIEVIDKPTVQIKMADFHMYRTNSQIQCTAAGYPKPEIRWKFKCIDSDCGLNGFNKNETTKGRQVISTIHVAALGSGVIECSANNSIGEDSTSQSFYVTDVDNGFGIFTSANILPTNNRTRKLVPIGDIAEIYCQGSRYAYNKDYHWFLNGSLITNSDNYDIENSYTQYSYKSKLTIKIPETGVYRCVVKKIMPESDNINKTAALKLIVSELKEPNITISNMQKVLHMDVPNLLKLTCYVDGIPRPSIKWFRNDMLIPLDNRTEMSEDGQVLIFKKTFDSDEGLYTCLAENKVGKVSRDMKVVFDNKRFSVAMLAIIIIILIVIVVSVTTLSIFQCRKERQYKKQLKEVGLQDFEKGDINKINPEQGLSEQASWLPYEGNKWEFSIDKLKLGKQLGSGAFGVVMKADAYGILEDEVTTTVAVKTIKPNADDMHLRALASELKIMGQIGKHLNVVNLLGACTKNLVKKQLYVIVEYCRYGNLQTYLFKHRLKFVSQIDERTGKFDFTIGAEALMERSLSFSSYRSNSQSGSQKQCIKYPSLKSHSEMDPMSPDYTGQTTRTESTVLSTSRTGNEDTITSNNSSEGPDWRLHYRGDYMDDNQLLYTKDLLAWAFQVANGMEYLVSRKVLHRDLATRNILLADNNIVKICDFGLAKETLDYEKKGDTPLPIKWMAVESIQDKVFSTQSDVWSYGIVLWELFSMAKSPYPGMTIDDNFLKKIINGYRMEIPQYATNDIYKIMLDCWHHDPLCRPSFTKLAERIGSILEDSVKQYYIDLNDPYLVANTQLIHRDTDYLAMFAPPDFEHISSAPKYMNDSVQLPDTVLHPEGYMCMKQPHIFSPRPEDYHSDGLFNYDFTTSRGSSKDSGVELQPMLMTSNRGNASDCESSQSPPQTPIDTNNSVSNPTYLSFNMPMFKQHHYQNVNSSLDNYINMNQKKLVVTPKRTKDDVKVPKIIEQNEDLESVESPYANSTTRDWNRLAEEIINR